MSIGMFIDGAYLLKGSESTLTNGSVYILR